MVIVDNQASLDLVARRRGDMLAVDSKSGNKSDGRIDPFTHGNPPCLQESFTKNLVFPIVGPSPIMSTIAIVFL
jgi:hypothetical protein